MSARGEALTEFLQRTDESVRGWLEGHPGHFEPEELREQIWSYIVRPAKRLRPAVLLMSCGGVGGRIERAVPAAACVEVFHTWTLVHDDLIDNDPLRRGAPTVHEAVARSALARGVAPDDRAREYGRDIAILAGDVQHGWSSALLADCALEQGVDARVVLGLVRELETSVLGRLIEGEVLDVQFALLQGEDWAALDRERIVEMLALKTGVLYGFAGAAGARIGLESADPEHPQVVALQEFALRCGIAFQLQDDILGVVADEARLGKPVGSDIREGKKTVVVLEALRHADARERATILSVLGKRDATAEEVGTVSTLFRRLGGIERTRELAREYVTGALPYLERLADSPYKGLLRSWAEQMVERSF